MGKQTVISGWDGVRRQDSISRWRELRESLCFGMIKRVRPTKGDIRRMDDRVAWAGSRRWPRYEVNSSSFRSGSSMHSKAPQQLPSILYRFDLHNGVGNHEMQSQPATETYPEARPSCTGRGTWDASSCGLLVHYDKPVLPAGNAPWSANVC
jgi:hypothetical protein